MNNFQFSGIQHAYIAAHYDDFKNSSAWEKLSPAERKRICSYKAMMRKPEKYSTYKMLQYTEEEFQKRLDTAALIQYFTDIQPYETLYVYTFELFGQKVRSKPVNWQILKTIVDAHQHMGVTSFNIEIYDCDDSANLLSEQTET